MKPATTLGVFVLAVIAFGHLLRVLLSWSLIINDTLIPMWPSVLVIVVFGTLSVLIFREACKG
jgi:hypothetical protein